MEYTYKYKDSRDRLDKIKQAESKGQVMLHDNFDSDWKRGEEIHGTLIFTDTPPVMSVVVTRDPLAELDDLKAKLKAAGIAV